VLLKLLLEVDVDGRLWAGRRTLQKDLFRRNRPAPCEFGQVAGFTHEASQTRISRDPPVFSWFDPCFVNRSGEFSQERLAWLLRQRPNLPAEDRNRLSSALSAGATTADLTEPRRGRRPLFIPQRDFTRTWVLRFRPVDVPAARPFSWRHIRIVVNLEESSLNKQKQIAQTENTRKEITGDSALSKHWKGN
jgi:hypothetical protein